MVVKICLILAVCEQKLCDCLDIDFAASISGCIVFEG